MTPEMFRKLAALGLSTDQMAGVLEIFEADAEARKEKARTRVQKWREKHKSETQRNVTEHNETQQQGSRTSVARVEDITSNLVLSGEDKDTSPSARSKRGERIPDDFSPDQDWAIAQGLTPAEAKHEAAQFLDYWRGKPGKDGLKLDWPGTWRMWVRNVLKRRAERQPQRSNSPPAKPRNAGESARLELIRRQEQDAASSSTRLYEPSHGNAGSPGSGFSRRIAIAHSR